MGSQHLSSSKKTKSRRTSLALLALLLAAILLPSFGCGGSSTYGSLRKGKEYLFEMSNDSAEKHRLPPAFRGVVLKSRGKGKQEKIELRYRGSVRKVRRSAFSRVSAL